jgi:hypothetical protein
MLLFGFFSLGDTGSAGVAVSVTTVCAGDQVIIPEYGHGANGDCLLACIQV